MRRTPTLLITSALLFAACGGSDDADGDAPADVEEVADASEEEDTTTAEETPDATADAGDDPVTDDADDAAESSAPDTPVEKPEVDVPGEAPAELQRTVLIEGDGPEAEIGDVVVVDYVGVRSLDGEEFDNSYDRGQPFPVTLGTGSVIQGWEQGLLGARAGDRLQLDIPSDLAYGPAARSEVIRENEPLTFVIDVREIIDRPDPADAPTEPGVDLTEAVEATVTETLVDGDGDGLEPGDTIVFHYVLFRGDNGVQLESSWVGQPPELRFDTEVLFPGFVDGLVGMQVGERRAITMSAADSPFGEEGNPQAGLPAGTPSIWVVDLLEIR